MRLVLSCTVPDLQVRWAALSDALRGSQVLFLIEAHGVKKR